MATNVIVIDSAARRATIKTSPATYLSDVLADACAKLGANPSQYGLKHNNKPVDLSRTIRLSGLSSGAKLELVQLSKSVGVVNVALQLPEADSPGSTSRLTDKFPSSTTLWLLLRKFESGMAGATQTRNFTARGVPSVGAGAGRLYYEQPILTAMGRELNSFTDLQKTLAQLGFNTGNVLIRLTFKTSDTPLEEAMTQIRQYFDDADPANPEPDTATPVVRQSEEPVQQVLLSDINPEASSVPSKTDILPEWTEVEQNNSRADEGHEDGITDNSVPTISDRPVSVYRPPTASGPIATTHNEADYVPTVEHAQAHQKHLQQEARNRRLPTDAELLAKQKELHEELGNVDHVEIRVRFPDQSAVASKFRQDDTAASLYNFVRQCVGESLRAEPFTLRDLTVRDRTGGILAENSKRLIVDLQLKGRVLLTFAWHDAASPNARATKDVLKDGLKKQARDFVAAPVPNVTESEDNDCVTVNLGPKQESTGGNESKGKVPKWLKGLGKK